MPIQLKAILRTFRRPVPAVTVVGLLILTTVGVKARVWPTFAPVNTRPQQLLPAQNGPAQIVRFTIYDAGIFPRDARVSAGSVALHIEDRSGNSVGLVVANGDLQTVAQVVRSPRRLRGNGRFALGPGRYTVYDGSRPLNRATLIIEP
jgi:hypothetical protein